MVSPSFVVTVLFVTEKICDPSLAGRRKVIVIVISMISMNDGNSGEEQRKYNYDLLALHADPLGILTESNSEKKRIKMARCYI